MPELAEVETIRGDLASVAVGQVFTAAEVFGPRTVRRHAPETLTQKLPGRTIVAVRRKGKYLLIDLDDTTVLMVHLRMSGQLLWRQHSNDELQKHVHARLWFASGSELRFVDPRTFGELWLSSADLPSMAHIGPDALNELPYPADLAARFVGRSAPLKALLLNQEIVSGIGNIYSDEMLWEAELRYSTAADALSRAGLLRLHTAIKTVLSEAVARRGSTLRDQQYVDLFGQTGGAQRSLNVYDRELLPCLRCQHPISRMKFGGRSTFFCPHCQR